MIAIISIEEIKCFSNKKKRIIGLDIGTKKIGIAVSDFSFFFAHPKPFIKRKKFYLTAKDLLNIFKIYEAYIVVAGFPINMNGSIGYKAQSTKSFIKNMIKITKIPFLLWDERLSTVAAKKNIISNNIYYGRYNDIIDSESAVFILQGVLDSLRIMRKNKLNF